VEEDIARAGMSPRDRIAGAVLDCVDEHLKTDSDTTDGKFADALLKTGLAAIRCLLPDDADEPELGELEKMCSALLRRNEGIGLLQSSIRLVISDWMGESVDSPSAQSFSLSDPTQAAAKLASQLMQVEVDDFVTDVVELVLNVSERATVSLKATSDEDDTSDESGEESDENLSDESGEESDEEDEEEEEEDEEEDEDEEDVNEPAKRRRDDMDDDGERKAKRSHTAL
jgi:TATA-binding protein-associated factor Taf7